MKVLKYLLYKEFVQTIRNKVTLRFIILMPTFLLLVLPWALTFDQKDILLSVVDLDKSSTSKKITQNLSSNGYFHLKDYSSTYEQAMEKMDEGKVEVILTIPKYFEKNLVLQQNPMLSLTVDAVNGMKGSIIMTYFARIIQGYNQNLAEQSGGIWGVEMKPYYRYNTHMQYHDFMVPGILVILMSLIGGMLASLNIVREKELGTIDQINVSPLPKVYFILGKLIPFWVIGMIILTMGIFVGWSVYSLFPNHNILNLYFFSFCYMIAFSGFGIIISNYTENQQQAILTIYFFMMIFILLSGLFTPISSMPNWAKALTIVNPFRYFVETIRMLYLKGSTFQDILPNLGVIFIFAIFFNGWAVISYKKDG